MSKSRHLEPTPDNSHGKLHRVSAGQRRLPSVSSQQEDSEVSLGFILTVWNQWWKWLIPVSLLLAVATSAIVMYQFQPKFLATARLEIAEESPYVLFRDDNAKADRFVQTQIEMIRSPRVLNAAFQDEIVAKMPEFQKKDPVPWLVEKGLKVELIGQSNFVLVAYEGPDPTTAAHFVNTVVDEYFSVQKSQKNIHTTRMVDILDDAKDAQEGLVRRLQEQVKELGRHLPDVTPSLTGSGLVVAPMNPLQALADEILSAELQIETLKASVSVLEASANGGASGVPEALVRQAIEELPEIGEIKLKLHDMQSKLTGIEVTMKGGKDSPTYISHLASIKTQEQLLESTRAAARETMTERVLASDLHSREIELEEKRRALKAKQELLGSLDRRYTTRREEFGQQAGARLEFEFAQTDLTRAVSLLSFIAERGTQKKAELVAPGRSDVYSEASPPLEPEQKYPIVELLASTVGSFVVPFVLAFFWENSVRRISSVEQLEHKTDVGVIGEISRLPARNVTSASRLLGHELGLFEESIDSLRTGLQLSNDEQDMQVLAVCSAVSGEGKTSVSSQLAVSIARATGQPVLLIDGDMRAPDIHQIFDVPLSPGLADVLAGDVTLEDSINRSWSEHVHLLPAGELTKSPHKLLGNSTFRSMLDEARLWYRYIVVDTPPVLAASESLVIAKNADAALLCAMRDFSRENHVRLAQAKLRSTGAEMIGTVLNGVPVRSYAQRYGSYGRYGYAGNNS